MILDYYKSIGLPVLAKQDYNNSDANLINHLFVDMNGYFLGVELLDWKNGMVKHLGERSFTGTWWVWHYSAGSPDAYQYESSIDSNRPVAIRFNYAFWDTGQEFSHHWIAGIGYNNGLAGLEVAYKDPDGGEYNTGTHWFIWNNNKAYFGTVHTNWVNQ